MKLPEWLKRIFGFLAVIIALFISWSCAYWLTGYVYGRFDVVPHEFIRQVSNSLLGFFIFGCGVYLITRIPWVRARQEKFLHPLINAMKMMAEGNFNIDLSFYTQQMGGGRNEHPYSRIVESITEMAEKLGKMEEMRQEFISNVSHEIQSPLTSIMGFAHALKNENLGHDERKHYLDIIETESIRLSRLSDNLLKLTSLESEHPPFELKEYRLDHQIRRIILANEPQWSEKEINMEIDLEHLSITADQDLMDQVWINLIHNSIKFTPEKGTIAVEAFKKEDDLLIVEIKDTGIGMNQEALLHIFERFYKADQSRHRKYGGSGLGLPIVKKIIDLHNGSIHVESEPGKGTKVTVELKPRQLSI
ncbi:Signal transduction histidine kinase [Fictibacillus solisalsi]|uniref:histidine kinase n=1 Tax=Fictibacillus solisalsi TaxID=459525 RepID=A0A1H0BEE1_9BACL|nr:HAMP domain-containing sensor histidine kinase [Fictibacillus solisalsi]SDN44009.1 Signal transduction histidine kinase [Fictibacillus solisalsi]